MGYMEWIFEVGRTSIHLNITECGKKKIKKIKNQKFHNKNYFKKIQVTMRPERQHSNRALALPAANPVWKLVQFPEPARGNF